MNTTALPVILPAAYLIAVAAAVSPKLAAAYLAAGAISFFLYRRDKTAAVRQQRRIPENALHTADLLGGWVGAWAARHRYRHKTAKTSFITVFWLSVAGNAALTYGIWRLTRI
ncbi:DUF1294 domain-containing protein [Neisseria animalis]|nr:DUF1294 domain-containing protein [Neisseria animalis]